jgi:hypothetical protein
MQGGQQDDDMAEQRQTSEVCRGDASFHVIMLCSLLSALLFRHVMPTLQQDTHSRYCCLSWAYCSTSSSAVLVGLLMPSSRGQSSDFSSVSRPCSINGCYWHGFVVA